MATKGQAYIHVLGPGSWTIEAVDCGHVLKGIFKVPSSTVSALTGLYANASVAEFHITENPMLEIEFAQDDLVTYAQAIQGTTRNTSSAAEVLTGGKIAGFRITPVAITYTPNAAEISGSSGGRKLSIWKAIPVGEPQIVFGLEQQVLKATFKVIIDESKADGEKFYRFGDTAVSADTTAPTVSASSFTDGDSGVSKTAAKTITFSEILDPASVNSQNVFLVPSTSTGIESVVAATVTLDSTGLIVSITPDSALAGTTEYDLMLSTGIKDAAGNRFAGKKYSFTTAA